MNTDGAVESDLFPMAAGVAASARNLSGNPAARTAAVAVFGIAHRLGDHIRGGECRRDTSVGGPVGTIEAVGNRSPKTQVGSCWRIDSCPW